MMHFRYTLRFAVLLVSLNFRLAGSFGCYPALKSQSLLGVKYAAIQDVFGGPSRRVARRSLSSMQTGQGEDNPINGRDLNSSGSDNAYPGNRGSQAPRANEWQKPKPNDGFSEAVPRINSVFMTGYLGQDPKPKYFDNGKVVLNLSLAVKREYHPLERKAFGIVYGEEETDWFQLEMWNRDAEYAAKICRKGARIGVQGSLSISTWTDREGRPRTTNKILVQNLELLDSKAEIAARQDRSEENLWESERLEKASAAERRRKDQTGGASDGASQSNPGDKAQQERMKEAEDKWWSAKPETDTAGGAGSKSGGGGGGEASWWDEDSSSGRGGGDSRGIEPDALPSFFDD